MKIEKISENQIKLTLTKNDLKDNNIKIEELVKPSDKVQELFRNLMEKAFSECGFEVDNTLYNLISSLSDDKKKSFIDILKM